MNAGKYGLSGTNFSVNRKNSMEYSRHLSDITRSTTMMGNGMGNKRSRASSDSEAIASHSRNYHNHYEGFRKRNLTLKESVKDMSPQRQVYNLDNTFHRKFGHNNERKEVHNNSDILAPSPRNLLFCGMDDDDRSFCDSVSSIACSDFTNADAETTRKWNEHKLSHKNAKFDAIETWLQHLPKPDLRPEL